MKSDKAGAKGIGPEKTTTLSLAKGYTVRRRSAMVRIVYRFGYVKTVPPFLFKISK